MKYRNISGRVVAGVDPGGIITRFPAGTNIRALVRARLVEPAKPAAKTKKPTDDLAEGGDADGDTGTR